MQRILYTVYSIQYTGSTQYAVYNTGHGTGYSGSGWILRVGGILGMIGMRGMIIRSPLEVENLKTEDPKLKHPVSPLYQGVGI